MQLDPEQVEQGLAQLFNGCPRTVVPWQSAVRAKQGRDTDLKEIRQILNSRVVLCEVDPLALRASQPYILLEHVRYYLRSEWAHTGRTSADRSVVLNRFPLVIPDDRGNLRIVAGHHRAAAALITGQALLVRTRVGGDSEPTALTPTLFLNSDQDPSVVHRELGLRGLSDHEIAFACRVARVSVTCVGFKSCVGFKPCVGFPNWSFIPVCDT